MTAHSSTSWPTLSASASRRILKAAPALMRRLTVAQHCDWTNTAWLSFCGRTVDQERALGWTSNLHPEDVTPVIGKLLTACANAGPVHLQYRLRRADGEYRWVDEQGGGLWTSNGFSGHVLVCREAPEDMQQTLALQLAAERARYESFAHRTKNTLQVILSTLQLAVRDNNAGQMHLRQAVRRIQSIIAVQSYADTCERAGKLDVVAVLTELTRSIISTQPLLRLEYELPDQPVLLATSRATALALIVGEAVINAIGQAESPGAISIRAAVEQAGAVLGIEIGGNGPLTSLGVPAGADPAKLESLLLRSMAVQAGAQFAAIDHALWLRVPLA